jgi:16S rRNA (cytosine967-C5)-methyltransferase
LKLKQQAIVDSAARLLKPGGRLVYATCSLLRAENEDIAEAFERAQGEEYMALPAGELLAAAQVAHAKELDEDGRLRLWPHRHGTDGFFAAVWQRR